MRKKIIGAIFIVMLSLPVIYAVGDNNKEVNRNENISSTFQEDISISINPAFLGIDLEITNNGDTNLNNVEWSFRSKPAITGTGYFINEILQEGVIEEIAAEEKITLQFRPLNMQTRSPIGLGNIYMNASVNVDDIYVRTQQRAIIIGFFLLSFKETYMDIKPPEAYDKLQNEEFNLIIDVVGLDIYSLGHLPGAVNYVWADGTLNSKISELDPSWIYLVYCHTDPPSTASAQALVDAGFENIYRLEGNFNAWKNAGYPIET